MADGVLCSIGMAHQPPHWWRSGTDHEQIDAALRAARPGVAPEYEITRRRDGGGGRCEMGGETTRSKTNEGAREDGA